MIDAINSVLVRAYVSLKREEGQTFVEYSLIGVLIAVVLAGVLITFESKLGDAFVNIQKSLGGN